MKLNELKASKGARHARKRLGCGIGSGHGKTSGRGHKGQKSRSGGKVARGFEGGQMPLIRRLPKRGFTSMAKGYQLVNVGQLDRFEEGAKIDAAALYEAGLVRNALDPIKLLARGSLSKKLDVSVTAASAGAKAKVAAAGGSLTLTGEA
ncbi:MAG: 50S ribosomal protein L15 [Zetaproteobacteria bacterium]|nr:MAG: 50S ribosomal protein L15 [Zetaproteobacteria bacterium]